MNDDKPFQLFRDEDDENADIRSENSAGGNARSSFMFIVLLMLVIGGAVTVLVIKLSSDDRKGPTPAPEDPNMYMVKPNEFMNDINSTIDEFIEFLETIDDEITAEDAEQAFAAHLERIENVANQSMNMGEPTDEERPELNEKVAELKTSVLRLGQIEQQKRANRELWKVIGPHYSRFDAALHMIPLIPPAGYVDPNPEIPNPEIPEPEIPNPENPNPEIPEPETSELPCLTAQQHPASNFTGSL